MTTPQTDHPTVLSGLDLNGISVLHDTLYRLRVAAEGVQITTMTLHVPLDDGDTAPVQVYGDGEDNKFRIGVADGWTTVEF